MEKGDQGPLVPGVLGEKVEHVIQSTSDCHSNVSKDTGGVLPDCLRHVLGVLGGLIPRQGSSASHSFGRWAQVAPLGKWAKTRKGRRPVLFSRNQPTPNPADLCSSVELGRVYLLEKIYVRLEGGA